MTAISVVMAVYNGGDMLARTLDALLNQSERDFELIVVDDGSSDGTPAVLASYAHQDERVCVIRQDNLGLTRALVHGCSRATAPLIAREDSGDRSHPERLSRQLAVFRDRPDAVLVASSNRTVSPSGEEMFISTIGQRDIRNEFLHEPSHGTMGIPSHSSSMFRRGAYEAVGGYRTQFYFAQDLDLWVRLARVGSIVVLPEVLHETVADVATISGRYRAEQLALTALIIGLRDARSSSESEALLEAASRIGVTRRPMSRLERARALYFIGSCLAATRNPAARRYLLRSIAAFPLLAGGWLKLLSSFWWQEAK